MKKLKLKPSFKEQKHYLLLKIDSKKKLSDKEAIKKIDESILNFIGILGYAFAGPLYVKIYDEKISKIMDKNNLIILCVTTKFVDHVKTSLILNNKTKVQCIRVSGTLKKLKEFMEEMK